MKRKLLTGIALAALLTATATAAGFAKTKTYPDGKFADVPATEWYASEVKNTFELGLMNGTSDTTFEPNGNVTVAEAITMATRATSIYAGETIPAAEGEWYQMYVNYALAKGLIKEGQFDNYDRPAKRYEVASIFENAMPDGYFAVKNNVDEIPDVDKSLPYSEDLLTLYKAGVVMGSDSYGNFKPEDNIIRAEAAAIINRVALPENRLSRTLDKYSKDEAYVLDLTSDFNGTREGIESGWRLDSRGGIPRSSIDGGYGAFSDISDDDGVAMIRDFNKTTTGRINLRTTVTVSNNFDGFSLEFNNQDGEPVYKVYTLNKEWTILQPDGTYKTIMGDLGNTLKFYFDITVDLDNGRSTTYINKVDCGTYPLAQTGDKLNIMDFRFATDEKSRASVLLAPTFFTVNYAAYETFSWHADNTIPFGWTGYGGANEGGILKVQKDGYVNKAFIPVSGEAIVDFHMNLDKRQSTAFDVRSGAKSIVKFTTDDNNFYANGVKVYENYYQNVWYRVRLQLKTLESKAVIWVNGRIVAEVDFAEKTTSIDNMSVSNASADKVSFDDIRAFEKKYFDDYVPVPVKPKGEEKYKVGINICSLWQNGVHWGWHCITPYDDIHPVLGYYDEGIPETADWEIKYMVEHGIDFQAFCWYSDSSSETPIKAPRMAAHLYDGYMYSEYSDMMEYCLIWEAANAGKPNSLAAWKNNFVPYFIENFFKDERYLKLDNKPVLAVFGSSSLATQIGGAAVLKEAFDYLEEEVKKLGFDGMVYLSSHSDSGISSMGFDGFVAYNWGTSGNSLSVNKSSNERQAAKTSFYTVPTISVGFNSIPWHGTRYPLMTTDDFRAAHTWIRDEYLPKNQTKGSWNENLAWISTWNEYGEGTYIMPTTDEKGFGWLDVLREVYTDEKADPSLNVVPTEEQLRRINRLYPQHIRLLRRQGYETEEIDVSELSTVETVVFNSKDKIGVGNCKSYEFREDGLHGTVNGDTLIQAHSLAIDANTVSHVKITIDVPKGTNIEFYFITNEDSTWSGSKGTNFVATESGLNEYIVDMTKKSTWKDTVTVFRVDPGQSASGTDGNAFHVKSIEFLAAKEAPSKKIIINGATTEMKYSYRQSEKGDVLVAFDPSSGTVLDHKLGVFHTWDAATKALTIEANKHKVVYTLGSSDYTLDGNKKSLGFKLDDFDGLPLIPIEMLCKDLGLKCEINEAGEAVIETNQKYYYDMTANRKLGEWEFELDGDAEGWHSSHMVITVSDGIFKAVSNSTHRDPIISFSKNIDLVAKKYKAFEIKCRFSHDDEKGNGITMYFTTDSDGTMKESMTIKHSIPQKSEDWVVYTVDLTENPAWKGIIKQLRFDPFNAVGTMEIDYMKFIENDDYDEAAAAKELEEANAFSFKNGNADGGVEPFTSNNANISVVKEADGNNVFLVTSNAGKQWAYFRQSVKFTPGATYKVSYRVKLAGVGDIIDEKDPSVASQIILNFRFAHDTTDHIITKDSAITVGDGWQKRTVEYTIPKGATNRSLDQITFYSNPVGDNGVNYFIDDIVVEEILP